MLTSLYPSRSIFVARERNYLDPQRYYFDAISLGHNKKLLINFVSVRHLSFKLDHRVSLGGGGREGGNDKRLPRAHTRVCKNTRLRIDACAFALYTCTMSFRSLDKLASFFNDSRSPCLNPPSCARTRETERKGPVSLPL